VLAAGGYPDQPETGLPIKGLANNMKDTFVFHGGTKREGKNYLTSGGRVLSVVGWSEDLGSARDKAYKKIGKIFFEESQKRCDIAVRVNL
jgi:phosphoribosylamine--glycine ligase